jgi:two-component system NtrC family response regulator
VNQVSDDKPKLLIVEDDVGLQRQLKWCFDEYEVLIAGTRNEALAQLRRFEPPVVLQDLGLPPDAAGVSEGIATLKEIVSIASQTKVIVVTGNNDRDNAVRAVSFGAYDFYHKPVDTDVLKLIVSRAFHIYALEEQNRQLMAAQLQSPIEGLVATDDAMLRVCRMLERVAPTPASVLILGESGTGKELLARALHSHSGRQAGRFVAINCAAIPEQLLVSELFGHEKGAFTDAKAAKKGLMELADRGTLFLDEVSEMSLNSQAKFLRVLQERVLRRVGGTRDIKVDLRIIAATNRPLETRVKDGLFREDLFYRLNVIPILIPPLRERRDDIMPLARHFVLDANTRFHKSIKGFAPEAERLMMGYQWPGNVRELRNLIERLVILGSSDFIEPPHLPVQFATQARQPVVTEQSGDAPRTLAEIERAYIAQIMQRVESNKSKAAKILGISRQTLRKKLMEE